MSTIGGRFHRRGLGLGSFSCWRWSARSRLAAAASRVLALPAVVTLPIPVAGSARPVLSTGSIRAGFVLPARWDGRGRPWSSSRTCQARVCVMAGCPDELVLSLSDDGTGDRRQGRFPLASGEWSQQAGGVRCCGGRNGRGRKCSVSGPVQACWVGWCRRASCAWGYCADGAVVVPGLLPAGPCEPACPPMVDGCRAASREVGVAFLGGLAVAGSHRGGDLGQVAPRLRAASMNASSPCSSSAASFRAAVIAVRASRRPCRRGRPFR